MFSVKVDIPDNLNVLVAGKQMPFIAARALTWTAKNVQEDTRKELKVKFKLRNNWTVQGIRIKAAKKDSLAAEVYNKNEYMNRHVRGGNKAPKHQYLEIPVRNKEARLQERAKTRRPKQLTKEPGFFFAGLKSGRLGIFKRRGPNRFPIDLYAAMVPTARVKNDWNFYEVAEKSINENFPGNFKRSFDNALSTSRV